MIEGLDHVALGVAAFDAQLSVLTNALGMELRRMGTHYASGRRIAMLADGAGGKVELIETDGAKLSLVHLAFRVADVPEAFAYLQEQGFRPIRPPHELDAARAITALVEDPVGGQVQIIAYEPDSPDL